MASILRPHFAGPRESGRGRIPVIFDLVSFDGVTPLLPDDDKLVLNVNPSSFNESYSKVTERIQTRGGFVEQHWGDALSEISIEASTGGFVRLRSGITTALRRETIAYSKFMDILALFQNNGQIMDAQGNIVLSGMVRITYDTGVHLGHFEQFSYQETAEDPFKLSFSCNFMVQKQIWSLSTHGSPRTTSLE